MNSVLMKFLRSIAVFAAGTLLLANLLEAKPHSCRVVFPERPSDAPKIAYLFDGTESRMTALPSMNLAPVIQLPDGDLTIVMTADEIRDPEMLPAGAPRLTIPEGVRDFYIFVTPDPENQHFPVKMNLVDPGKLKLKPGDTLWFNGTAHRIGARLGDTKIVMEPNGRVVSSRPVARSGHYAAKFAYQANGEGPYAPITEQYWWHDVGSRHLGFIVNTGGKLPKIYFYRDFRNPVLPASDSQ